MPKTDKQIYIEALQISYNAAVERIDELERYENKYLELKERYNRMEKEYKDLQVEHSRMLFDIDAVIEHEVEVKCKKLTAKLEKEKKKLKTDAEDMAMYNVELLGENKSLKIELSKLKERSDL